MDSTPTPHYSIQKLRDFEEDKKNIKSNLFLHTLYVLSICDNLWLLTNLKIQPQSKATCVFQTSKICVGVI